MWMGTSHVLRESYDSYIGIIRNAKTFLYIDPLPNFASLVFVCFIYWFVCWLVCFGLVNFPQDELPKDINIGLGYDMTHDWVLFLHQRNSSQYPRWLTITLLQIYFSMWWVISSWQLYSFWFCMLVDVHRHADVDLHVFLSLVEIKYCSISDYL